MMKKTVLLVATGALLSLVSLAEAPYAFRTRLTTVHRNDRRDWSRAAAADEYAFPNGAQIVVADDASALVRSAAEDFREYLLVSMNVNASVRGESDPARPGLARGVTVRTDRRDAQQGFEISVAPDGVTVNVTVSGELPIPEEDPEDLAEAAQRDQPLAVNIRICIAGRFRLPAGAHGFRGKMRDRGVLILRIKRKRNIVQTQKRYQALRQRAEAGKQTG